MKLKDIAGWDIKVQNDKVYCLCPRCYGTGIYRWGACINGQMQFQGVCFKCKGVGMWHIGSEEDYNKLIAERDEKARIRQEKIDAAKSHPEVKALLAAVDSLSAKLTDLRDQCQTSRIRWPEWASPKATKYNDYTTSKSYIAKLSEIKETIEAAFQDEGEDLLKQCQEIQEAKAKKEAEAEANRAKQKYIGTVGEKVDLEVTVKHIHDYENQWGTGSIYFMETPDGDLVNWFTSSSPDGMEKGETVKIMATIKKHEEYKNNKQTVVTRVKLV